MCSQYGHRADYGIVYKFVVNAHICSGSGAQHEQAGSKKVTELVPAQVLEQAQVLGPAPGRAAWYLYSAPTPRALFQQLSISNGDGTTEVVDQSRGEESRPFDASDVEGASASTT